MCYSVLRADYLFIKTLLPRRLSLALTIMTKL